MYLLCVYRRLGCHLTGAIDWLELIRSSRYRILLRAVIMHAWGSCPVSQGIDRRVCAWPMVSVDILLS